MRLSKTQNQSGPEGEMKKSPFVRRPGSNMDRPVRSQEPRRLLSVKVNTKNVFQNKL